MQFATVFVLAAVVFAQVVLSQMPPVPDVGATGGANAGIGFSAGAGGHAGGNMPQVPGQDMVQDAMANSPMKMKRAVQGNLLDRQEEYNGSNNH